MGPKKSNSLIWIIPVGCLGIFLLSCGGCVLVPFMVGYSVLTGNEVYQAAMDKVKNDPRVIDELGEPISAGWTISGNFHSNNGHTEASFDIPIAGPKGSAEVHVEANGTAGNMKYDEILVRFADKEIDLAGEEGIVVDTIVDEAEPENAPPVPDEDDDTSETTLETEDSGS